MRKKLDKIVSRKKALGLNPLLVGIDIGSVRHAVAFMDRSGRLLARTLDITNSREGYDALNLAVQHLEKCGGYTGVHIGMEPTGHYWRNIGYYLLGKGYAVHFIRTTALKHQRELDDSSPSKSDERDAAELAMLLKEGRYLDSELPTGIYKELRELGKHRQRLMEGKTATVLRLGGFLDNYFPGLRDVFWSMDAKGLWALLRTAPFPEDVVGLGLESLVVLLSRSARRGETGRAKAEKVMQRATAGIALPATESARVELRACLDLMECYHRQLKAVAQQMEAVVQGNDYCDLMRSIDGIGTVTIATFIGELGNPDKFTHPNEVVSFCGLDPSEASSGNYKSGFRISKKGRYLMRTMLYFMAMRVVRWNARFRAWYERKIKKHGLAKKSALVAVCIKLIRILFAMFKSKSAFDQTKVEPKNIRLRPMAQAA